MPAIKIRQHNLTLQCPLEKNLFDFFVGNKIIVDSPCGGNGVCGKCKVKILEGRVNEPLRDEINLLSPFELKNGIRLACKVFPVSDLSVEIPEAGNPKILEGGFRPDFIFKPAVNSSGLGIAVDIGTTTVVAELIDLSNGDKLSSVSFLNPQKKYGSDVLSRISYLYENPEGLKEIQKILVDDLNDALSELCRKASCLSGSVSDIVVSANNTMLHILLAIDPSPLGRYPFKPVFTEPQNLLAKEIGLSVESKLHLLPSVSAYIGADIVSGVYVSDLFKHNNSLLLDIGTNGEMVLNANGAFISCSCSAGPAFEGMNISCGMNAREGAIEDVQIGNTGVALKVIGETEALGICGSGILSLVKELISNSLLTKRGALRKQEDFSKNDFRHSLIAEKDGKRCVKLTDDGRVFVTMKDIRSVQLAKGAILSAFYSLISKGGILSEQIDRVFIAGQFGANLQPEYITGAGLLPKVLEHKINYLGNSSLSGAYMALMSTDVRAEMAKIAKRINYIDLGTDKGYERLFLRCLDFDFSI